MFEPILALLVPILPLAAALWLFLEMISGRLAGEAGEAFTSRVTQWGCGGSLLLLLLLDLLAAWRGDFTGPLYIATWLHSGTTHIPLMLTLDRMALTAATMIALLAWLTLRFSIHYLHREEGYHRFFAILSFFTSGMLWFVLAGNGVVAFVGWEMMGISSYLLIGFDRQRETASRNASQVFITNRFGDAGFILANTLALWWLGDVNWHNLAFANNRLDILRLGMITSCFILAALVKSGQFPFVSWLGRALEGPTPSSAIFYGSLMVHAGIFLLLRLEPLLKQFPILMSMLILLGGLTVLYSVWVALVQTDVKSALVLATQTQVGLMVVECGLGWFQLATWHMAAHAVWRLYQFLQAPSYMHQLTRPTRPVIPILAVHGAWFNAALQRFWLDHLANALLVRPTYRLARDVVGFDNQVIDRLTGKPDPRTHQAISPADSDRIQPVEGWGLAGGVIAQASAACDWLENHLILPMGGQGLVHHLHRLGVVLQRLDKLLAQPRYVVLLVFLTFAVIL